MVLLVKQICEFKELLEVKPGMDVKILSRTLSIQDKEQNFYSVCANRKTSRHL